MWIFHYEDKAFNRQQGNSIYKQGYSMQDIMSYKIVTGTKIA